MAGYRPKLRLLGRWKTNFIILRRAARRRISLEVSIEERFFASLRMTKELLLHQFVFLLFACRFPVVFLLHAGFVDCKD